MITFQGVNFSYTSKQRTLIDINFEMVPGRNIGVVGESGSGKSTLLKLALGLYKAQSGKVMYQGEKLNFKDRDFLKRYRQSVQAVFQDPYSSLDPKQRILNVIA